MNIISHGAAGASRSYEYGGLTTPAAGPRVSIVIAVHDGVAFIAKAIESALAQTETSLELLVVDDGSTDGTRAIVEQFCQLDRRVRLITYNGQRGPGHARNKGIEAAIGEWIAILDADDWYTRERLATLLAEAEKEQTSLLADDQFFARDGDARPYRRLLHGGKARIRRLTASDLLRHDKIGKAGNLGLLKPFIRRQSLLDHRIRYNEGLTVGEDFYFLLDCLRCIGALLLVAEPHYYYRIHPNSISTSPSVETLIPLLEAQKIQTGLFDPAVDPTTPRLMHERMRELHRYIRFKALMAPLLRGDLRGTLLQLSKEPAAVLPVAHGLARYLERRTAIYWSQLRTNLSIER